MKMRNVEDVYVLAPMQQGMLFHTLYAPQSGIYLVQSRFKIQGSLNVTAFSQAWQQVVDRHSILRTSFLWEGLDEPLQVVREWVPVPWIFHDWRDRPPQEQ